MQKKHNNEDFILFFLVFSSHILKPRLINPALITIKILIKNYLILCFIASYMALKGEPDTWAVGLNDSLSGLFAYRREI